MVEQLLGRAPLYQTTARPVALSKEEARPQQATTLAMGNKEAQQPHSECLCCLATVPAVVAARVWL